MLKIYNYRIKSLIVVLIITLAVSANVMGQEERQVELTDSQRLVCTILLDDYFLSRGE